jgi:hypothetical protein
METGLVLISARTYHDEKMAQHFALPMKRVSIVLPVIGPERIHDATACRRSAKSCADNRQTTGEYHAKDQADYQAKYQSRNRTCSDLLWFGESRSFPGFLSRKQVIIFFDETGAQTPCPHPSTLKLRRTSQIVRRSFGIAGLHRRLRMQESGQDACAPKAIQKTPRLKRPFSLRTLCSAEDARSHFRATAPASAV